MIRHLFAILVLFAGCDDSSITIRLVFPNAASIQRARTLALYAIQSEHHTCADVRGLAAGSLSDLIASAALDLREDALRFPDLPLRDMLLSALVHDGAGAHLFSGCSEVDASPGQQVEVAIYLDCAPGQSPCRDADGDGVASDRDCDDQDPCRSPLITEAPNGCSLNEDYGAAHYRACLVHLAAAGKPFLPPFCGDGIDQDCDGSDITCQVDADCDNFSPPQDCNDLDPKINPQAAEDCDGKDNNCNNVVDEGCLPCDVDGDQHADVGYPGTDCSYPTDDPDDYDAGRHPDTTTDDGGLEGGTVAGALREYCSATKKDKNGKLAQRDTDHDGDGKNAAEDGCPTLACDADGDGFKGAQCNPPASEKDCNDDDPTIFPGAPDICGNGIAENCVADGGCSCDADNDGYCERPANCVSWASCPAADCDDTNADVHPWATEKCDRIDNDCDNLVDEDNVDNTGLPMPVDVGLCNDDNHGKCGTPPKNGVCVCSAVDTRKVYTHDPADNRLKCTGESFSAIASPRCFQAVQPAMEHCDSSDWNCDGASFDSTKDVPADFVDYGATCGKSSGTCHTGIVTGCSLSQTLLSQQLSVLGSGFNPHWVCTDPVTKLPVKLPGKEECNGFDDDCDGVGSVQDVVGADLGWSELDEKDVDGDGYMKCSGPCPTLAPDRTGCNDCNDKVKTVHPGAFESCDGVDNNCTSGDEGADQCQGSSSCCPSQGHCRDLGSDLSNCGQCGNVCPSATSSACTGGSCVCGSSSSPCAFGLNCVGGTCQCVMGGQCGGCCDGNSCLPGNTIVNCGDGGESCSTCSTSNPCRVPVCTTSGNCSTSYRPNGTSCPGGLCRNGSCCTGCWNGSACLPGITTASCGQSGALCTVCSAPNPCVTASCPAGACILVNATLGTPCPGGACTTGTCCTGCLEGIDCHPGTAALRCGAGGAACVNCTAGGFVCVGQVCQ